MHFPSIHPSIHPLSITASPALRVTGVTGDYHSCLQAKMGLYPGQMSSSFIQFRQSCKFASCACLFTDDGSYGTGRAPIQTLGEHAN